jgi:hypothetical protein
LSAISTGKVEPSRRCVQLASGAHRTLRGVLKIAGPQRRVRRARRLGHQDVDRLVQQFVVGVAEQLLRLSIGQHDAAGMIDDQHRDRARMKGRIQQLLGQAGRGARGSGDAVRNLWHGPPPGSLVR